eukprot:TRINITY_DN15678_c0_g1_i2.p1 TRINITY_DN15678_c0_g1~~TRINITY_DN15678_c0_g1_i2.p1  ORF type:complete len:355 (-),score=79.26 TRINITY_DN15678_c0_g1_i2:175-1239(-)
MSSPERERIAAFNEAEPLSVAVIGAGALGQCIIAEMLLLGVDVGVFDRGLSNMGVARAQEEVDRSVFSLLARHEDVLQKAGLLPPSAAADFWCPRADEPPRQARFFDSVASASQDRNLIIEAVPDVTSIKAQVFFEASSTAAAGALFVTNTLTIPLSQLQADMANARAEDARRMALDISRVVGLRFLHPVVFIPFAEVTLTPAQRSGAVFNDLMRILHRLGKTAFVCDVRGAVGSAPASPEQRAVYRWPPSLGSERLRLDLGTAKRRQMAEAKIRLAHHLGEEAVKALRSADVFEFDEERCCVCLDAEPAVASMLCGHTVLCATCAAFIANGTKKCPICRVRFVQQIHETVLEL